MLSEQCSWYSSATATCLVSGYAKHAALGCRLGRASCAVWAAHARVVIFVARSWQISTCLSAQERSSARSGQTTWNRRLWAGAPCASSKTCHRGCGDALRHRDRSARRLRNVGGGDVSRSARLHGGDGGGDGGGGDHLPNDGIGESAGCRVISCFRGTFGCGVSGQIAD